MAHETFLIDSIYGISLHISASIVNYITLLLLFIFINNYMNVKMTMDSNIYFATPSLFSNRNTFSLIICDIICVNCDFFCCHFIKPSIVQSFPIACPVVLNKTKKIF